MQRVTRLLWIPLILVLLAFVGWLGLLITGHRTLVVMSGSMSPALEPGDVAVVRTVAPAATDIGDIVTFRDPTRDRQLVTHRVIFVRPLADAVGFVTKGDRNTGVEEWTVDSGGTVGRLSWRIPSLGHLLLLLGRPIVGGLMFSGAFLVIGVMAVRLALRLRGAVVERPAMLVVTAALGLALGAGALPTTLAAFSSATSNAGNTLQAASSFCTPGSVTAPATADAYVNKDDQNTNFGNGAELYVQGKSTGQSRRTLVRFGLPSIPSSCTFTSATLRLYANTATTGRTIEAYRLGGTWTESTVTWVTQPPTVGTPATSASGTGWRTWDVTTIVGSQYAGSNDGLLLRDQSETAPLDPWQIYQSREGSPNDPELIVNYG